MFFKYHKPAYFAKFTYTISILTGKLEDLIQLSITFYHLETAGFRSLFQPSVFPICKTERLDYTTKIFSDTEFLYSWITNQNEDITG